MLQKAFNKIREGFKAREPIILQKTLDEIRKGIYFW